MSTVELCKTKYVKAFIYCNGQFYTRAGLCSGVTMQVIFTANFKYWSFVELASGIIDVVLSLVDVSCRNSFCQAAAGVCGCIDGVRFLFAGSRCDWQVGFSHWSDHRPSIWDDKTQLLGLLSCHTMVVNIDLGQEINGTRIGRADHFYVTIFCWCLLLVASIITEVKCQGSRYYEPFYKCAWVSEYKAFTAVKNDFWPQVWGGHAHIPGYNDQQKYNHLYWSMPYMYMIISVTTKQWHSYTFITCD